MTPLQGVSSRRPRTPPNVRAQCHCALRGANGGVNPLERVEIQSASADFDLVSRRISFGSDLAQAPTFLHLLTRVENLWRNT